MSLILSGTDGLSDVDGSAATPAIRGTDANTGIFFGTDIIGFSEGGVEAARINADSQFVAAAGTAALPVITTTGDLNTGIFFPAADTIAFSEGGAEAMRINASGYLGIGTNSPSVLLNVVTASAGVNARVLIYSNSGGLPNTKIYESADISCATTGIKTITTSGTFTAGTITWIGIQVSGAPVLTALSLTACLPIAFSVITGAPTTAWSYTYAYGSAPATLNQAFRSSYANILPIIQFIQ